VGVFVICAHIFIVFCIVCTVFLCCIVYVYLFLFVLLPPSENSIAVNNNTNNNVLYIRIFVHLSECTSAAPTGRIFVKFYTGDFHENLSRNSVCG
jgi:hypothetical protein